MELLRLLTLIHAAVLVLALAASLITILIYLRRIDGALEEARAALERTGTATDPLPAVLGQLLQHVESAENHLGRAAAQLDTAVREAGATAERRGVGAAARQEA
jgi:hypothetical protein